MKCRGKVIVWIVGMLVVLLVVLVLVVVLFDWNCFKLFIDDKVSQVIGWLFIIYGDFSLVWYCECSELGWCSWLLWLQFIVCDIIIGNLVWVK